MEDYKKALLERQKKYLKEKFGIETHEQLLQALKEAEPLDIGIFVLPQVDFNKTA